MPDKGANARSADARSDDGAMKPESPTDITKPTWGYVARKTVREFSKDQCTDLAAALTYYAVLALFPAAIALTSILGLVGQSGAIDQVFTMLENLGGASMVDTVRPTIQDLASSQGTGFALVLGLLGALWSASGYVGAFGRAMNRMYEVTEGRPIWKLRPVNLLLTVLLVI